MRNTRSGQPALSAWTIVVIGAAVCLAAGTSPADTILAKAGDSWGNVKVKRDGGEIPYTKGMDLKDGDEIETGRNSGAKLEWLDRGGEVFGEESIYGLPGDKGCADAEGERGKARVRIKGKDRGPDKRKTVSKLIEGTSKFEKKPGKDSKDHEVIIRKGIARKKGTECAISYDIGSLEGSLSTLDGAVELDNIVWASLPALYFTDPGNKSFDTLNLDMVLGFTSDVVSCSDILGAGNTVDVNAGYYSILSSPPSAPVAGLAPIHALPGGLCPEPATLALLALGGLALIRRKR